MKSLWSKLMLLCIFLLPALTVNLWGQAVPMSAAEAHQKAEALLKQMTDELLADAFRCTSDKPGTGC